MSDGSGVRGPLVARFLEEVRGADVDDWRRYVRSVSEQPRGARREVFRTLDLGLGPAVGSAVDRAADEAYRSVKLASGLFPGQEARFLALHVPPSMRA